MSAHRKLAEAIEPIPADRMDKVEKVLTGKTIDKIYKEGTEMVISFTDGSRVNLAPKPYIIQYYK